MNYISPNYTYEKLENPSFTDLIDVFEDRTKHWIIVPAKQLLESEYGYFASIGVMLSYFEAIQSYLKGENSKNKSRQFFIDGFEAVFSAENGEHVAHLASTMYTQARCGFFHEGLTRERIFFSTAQKDKAILVTLPKINGELVLDGKVQSIIINPIRFHWCIQRHFTDYIKKIRDDKNEELRNNFKKVVISNWKLNEEEPVVGITEKQFFSH